jgi:hypothetical protein
MQLQFKSLRSGTLYTLTIGTASGTLTGAAEPFTTQEADDTDMFLPIRTQSGYIHTVGINDRDTWISLIPNGVTSKLVKLTHGNNVIDWQGFLMPGVFSNEWPGIGAQEHEFPVQCPLSVLDGIDMDVQDPTPNHIGIVTFGELLMYIFGKLTAAGITINHYYVQGTAAVTSARLALKVIWANFLTNDNNGTITARYTCYQVLEEVCKFFGYTCRMIGDAVYFTQPTGNTLGFTDYTSLTGTGTYSERSTFTINDNMLASNNMQEQVVPGVGRVTVSSDINKLDNLIEIPYDELFDRYNTVDSDYAIIIRALDQGDEHVYALIKNPDTNGGTLSYQNESVSLSIHAAKFDGDALTKNKYSRFLAYDTSDVGNPVNQEIPSSKKSFNWTKCVELFRGTEYAGNDATTMFTITSKQSFVVGGGILYVAWNMRETDAGQYQHMASDRPATLTAQMRIGDKYWAGTWDVANRQWTANSAWTTTPSTFTMYLDADGPKTTRKLATDPQYDGCGFPVEATMRGIIEFSIIDVQWWEGRYWEPGGWRRDGNNGFVPMLDFKIGFVRGTIEDTKHNGNEYTKQGGSFRGNLGVDLIFAADVAYGPSGYLRHMPAGLGYILNNSTEKPQATIKSMSGGDVTPEEYLAELIANYGQNTHRVVDVDLLTNLVGNVTPLNVAAGIEAGTFPLAVSHNWRDDVTHITLITL